MGTNKRYAEYYDRQMDARILQRIAADFPLQTLTDRELQASSLPVTRDPQAQALQGMGAIRAARDARRRRRRGLERPCLWHRIHHRRPATAVLGMGQRGHTDRARIPVSRALSLLEPAAGVTIGRIRTMSGSSTPLARGRPLLRLCAPLQPERMTGRSDGE
jgi:hypothetical protein